MTEAERGPRSRMAEFSEHGTGSEGRQPNIGASRNLQIGARSALGDYQHFVAGITLAEHDGALIEGLALHVCRNRTDVLRRESRKQRDLRQCDFCKVYLRLCAQQIVFRMFDRTVDIGKYVRA